MTDIMIHAESLGKKYTIGHQTGNGRYVALRDVAVQNARSLWHKTKDLLQGKPIIQGDTLEEVWALKDVSFEIRRGEVVGIIGRNGAGKSTLLKVLSRITEPSAGRVTIRGRVASLLEVGTGFHPELTGRENIYLNGAILGMRRAEIKLKFDEIVAFAEIEKFLDTPVKHYSSGMHVRLAFAVAAHPDPEILLVDEVLAVGDAAFQKKCLGKMGEVAREGRTVLLVSHNVGAVRSLCSGALLLHNGKLIGDGPVAQVVERYISLCAPRIASSWVATEDLHLPLQVISVKALDDRGQPCAYCDVNTPIDLVVVHRCRRPLVGAVVLVSVCHNGVELLHCFDTDALPQRLARRESGEYVDQIRMPTGLFKSGSLTVSIRTAVLNKNTVFQNEVDVIRVHLDDLAEDTSFKGYASNRSGLLRVSPRWEPINPTRSGTSGPGPES